MTNESTFGQKPRPAACCPWSFRGAAALPTWDDEKWRGEGRADAITTRTGREHGGKGAQTKTLGYDRECRSLLLVFVFPHPSPLRSPRRACRVSSDPCSLRAALVAALVAALGLGAVARGSSLRVALRLKSRSAEKREKTNQSKHTIRRGQHSAPSRLTAEGLQPLLQQPPDAAAAASNSSCSPPSLAPPLRCSPGLARPADLGDELVALEQLQAGDWCSWSH